MENYSILQKYIYFFILHERSINSILQALVDANGSVRPSSPFAHEWFSIKVFLITKNK